MLRQRQVTVEGRDWTVYFCPCRGDQYPYFTKPQAAHYRTRLHTMWQLQAMTTPDAQMPQ
jgi:hypothetical protein